MLLVANDSSLKDRVDLETIGAPVDVQEMSQVDDMQGKKTENRWIRTTINFESLSVGQSGG